jgi:hypothetical protein
MIEVFETRTSSLEGIVSSCQHCQLDTSMCHFFDRSDTWYIFNKQNKFRKWFL